MGHHRRSFFVRHPNKVFFIKRAFAFSNESQITMSWFFPLRPDILAYIGVTFHAIDINRLGGCQALDALQAIVGRMVLVRTHGDNFSILCLNNRSAADTTVRALSQCSTTSCRGFRGRHRCRLQFRVCSDHKTGSGSGTGDESTALEKAASCNFKAFHICIPLPYIFGKLRM